MMDYKGYIGKVEFDDEAVVFHGEVINTADVITFQGKSVAELKKAFRESIDDYLRFALARRRTRPAVLWAICHSDSPELHRQVNLTARLQGKSVNAWVSEQLSISPLRH